MSLREFWATVRSRFNPRESDQRRWLVERANSPVKKINQVLTSAVRNGQSTRTILLSGGIGAGKSSELYRVATQQQQNYLVVVFDLEDHLERISAGGALEKIEPWEVVLLAGLGAWKLGTNHGYFDSASSRDQLKQIKDAFDALKKDLAHDDNPDVDLAKVASSVSFLATATTAAASGVGAPAAIGAGAGLSKIVGEALAGMRFGHSSKLEDQLPSVQQLLAAVNAVLLALAQRARPVLFVLDGLDRVKSIDRANRLFVESSLLTKLAASVLLSSPFAFHHSVHAQNIRGFERVEKLYNERVFVVDPHNPYSLSVDPEGVRFFRALFDKRVTDLLRSVSQPFEPVASALFDRLVLASGGRPRAFVRLVHLVAENVVMRLDEQPESPSFVTKEDVDDAVDNARRNVEGNLADQDFDVLRHVIESAQHLPRERSPLWLELLTTDRVLAYSNGSEWYFPHPLLLEHRLRPRG